MSFAEFQDDFLTWTAGIVWCTVTTVDGRGRPRSRVLHPIWEVIDDAPVGWVVTSKTPVKTRHIAANPHVACMYWSPAQNTVSIDAVASWVEDAETKRHVFDLFNATPPLGYDLGGFGDEGPANPLFEPLRLDAWRVQLLRAEQMWTLDLTPRTWRKASG